MSQNFDALQEVNWQKEKDSETLHFSRIGTVLYSSLCRHFATGGKKKEKILRTNQKL